MVETLLRKGADGDEIENAIELILNIPADSPTGTTGNVMLLLNGDETKGVEEVIRVSLPKLLAKSPDAIQRFPCAMK